MSKVTDVALRWTFGQYDDNEIFWLDSYSNITHTLFCRICAYCIATGLALDVSCYECLNNRHIFLPGYRLWHSRDENHFKRYQYHTCCLINWTVQYYILTYLGVILYEYLTFRTLVAKIIGKHNTAQTKVCSQPNWPRNSPLQVWLAHLEAGCPWERYQIMKLL